MRLLLGLVAVALLGGCASKGTTFYEAQARIAEAHAKHEQKPMFEMEGYTCSGLEGQNCVLRVYSPVQKKPQKIVQERTAIDGLIGLGGKLIDKSAWYFGAEVMKTAIRNSGDVVTDSYNDNSNHSINDSYNDSSSHSADTGYDYADSYNQDHQTHSDSYNQDNDSHSEDYADAYNTDTATTTSTTDSSDNSTVNTDDNSDNSSNTTGTDVTGFASGTTISIP